VVASVKIAPEFSVLTLSLFIIEIGCVCLDIADSPFSLRRRDRERGRDMDVKDELMNYMIKNSHDDTRTAKQKQSQNRSKKQASTSKRARSKQATNLGTLTLLIYRHNNTK
jgi:hypothetical protein